MSVIGTEDLVVVRVTRIERPASELSAWNGTRRLGVTWETLSRCIRLVPSTIFSDRLACKMGSDGFRFPVFDV